MNDYFNVRESWNVIYIFGEVGMKLKGFIEGVLLGWKLDIGVINMFIIEDVYYSIFLE